MTLDELGKIIYNNFIKEIDSNNKIASGNFRNLTSYEVEINGGHYIIYMNMPAYWKYVEYGRNPGKWPPRKPIEDWIRVKPLVPTAKNGKVPTTEQLAFLIQRKIGLEGIEPTPILSNAIDNSKPSIDEFIKTLKEEVINIIKKI